MAGNAQLLPQFTTPSKDLTLLQSSWGAILNAVIRRPANNSIILKNVSLTTGSVNTINTTLARNLQGWKIVRQRAQATVWDSQDSNTAPNLTLLLNTSANVVVDLELF